MAGETVITVVGNLTADPQMRYTTSGVAVVSFTVASTARSYDRQTNTWKDGNPLYLDCTAWRDLAENIVETLTKGTRVIVQGRITQRSYETKDGQRRTVVEIQVDEVGPSLRYAKAQVVRNNRGGGFADGGSDGNVSFDAPRGGQDNDPWAASGYSDNVPF